MKYLVEIHISQMLRKFKLNDKNVKLEYVYDKTTDWFKFSEAKNAEILAINSAILFGVVRLALSYKPSDTLLVAYGR